MSTGRTIGRLFERGQIGYSSANMSWAHWLTGVLAAITGTIHLYLYWNQGFVPFLFASVVFYAAIIGLVLNAYRRLLYALGIPFTAGQLVMWVAQGMPDMEIAVIDKPVQVLLILVLVYLLVNEDRLTGGA